MKNKAPEALLIILLSGILLACVSLFIGSREIDLSGGTSFKFSFIGKNELFDFSKNNTGSNADSLIGAYIQDTVLITNNLKMLQEELGKMTSDSLKIREIVNFKLNLYLTADSSKREASVQKFINNYLSDEHDRKKRIIREELLTYLNLKNIKNEFLTNPEKNGIKALDKFFAYLMENKDTNVVRIVHYGDSQLEGDRVTSSLRENLQARFGGSGLGFVPLIDIADNLNLTRSHSLNWKRYTVFHDRFYNSFYGAAGVVFRFGTKNNKEITEDTITDGQSENEVSDTYTDRAFVTFNLASHVTYSEVSLMYGRSNHPCKINVFSGDELLMSDNLPETSTFSIFKLKIPAGTRKFKLEFVSSVSPDFYGLLIDGDRGVQIDNYALRGHSGDGLLLINPDYYALQMKQLNVRLIILEYGTNAVPYVRSEKMCAWLGGMYINVINRLKSVAPNASILFIGVGDMARNAAGGISSYPMLPQIRNAEKNAALSTNCAYWDLFESMGGANSILSWVKEHLAVMDGHLSPKGRDIMSKEIFDALMTEYDFYRYKPHKN